MNATTVWVKCHQDDIKKPFFFPGYTFNQACVRAEEFFRQYSLVEYTAVEAPDLLPAQMEKDSDGSILFSQNITVIQICYIPYRTMWWECLIENAQHPWYWYGSDIRCVREHVEELLEHFNMRCLQASVKPYSEKRRIVTRRREKRSLVRLLTRK